MNTHSTHTHTHTHTYIYTMAYKISNQSGQCVDGRGCHFFLHCVVGEPLPSHYNLLCSLHFLAERYPPEHTDTAVGDHAIKCNITQ